MQPTSPHRALSGATRWLCLTVLLAPGCKASPRLPPQPHLSFSHEGRADTRSAVFSQEAAAPRPDEDAPARRGTLSTAAHDLGQAPRRVWSDGKLVFSNGRNWAYLLAASTYALYHEHSLEDQEDAFFENHTIYGRNYADALGALGNGLTLYLGAFTWYFVAYAGDHGESYEASKTVLSAMTVTAVTTSVLKLTIPDSRPNGSTYDFPSGHASQAMAVAASLDELYGHGVGIPAYLLAGLVGLQRMDTGKHDSGSVLFAMVLGYVTGKTIASHHAPRIFGMELGLTLDPDTGEPALILSGSL